MRRSLALLAPVVAAALIASCSGEEPNKAVPSTFDTGFPVFETTDNDTGTPIDTGGNVDSGNVDSTVDSAPPGDVEFMDIMSTKDTTIGDVTVLMEGGPPDVPPDTTLPDSLIFLDTAPPDTAREAD